MESYVYLLRCRDDSLYAGWSTDPKQREKAHNSGHGAKYTRSRLPVKLVYVERCADKSEGLAREYQLKQLTRAQKEQLILSDRNELNKGESAMAKFPYTGVSHIGINTRDLDAALHFYCDILGMEIARQINAPEDLPPEAPLYALRGKPFLTHLKACNGVVIELFSPVPGREEITLQRNNFGYTHFCLDVTDMAEALRILKEENVTIESEPAPTGGAAWIRDPDGNLIELMPPRPLKTPGAHLMGISHTAFNCSNLEASLRFYCDLLGFQFKFDIRIPETIPETSPFYALRGKPSLTYLEAPDGSYLELFTEMANRAVKDPDDNRVGYAHLSLQVADIKAASEFLRTKGVRFDSEITKGPDNTYQVWIRDPDGNRIELMEYTNDSLQL